MKPLQALYFRDIYNDHLTEILNEIFRDKIYQPIFNNKKDLTVIDIGANIGLFTYYVYPFCKKLYAIEPAQEHYEVLTEMIKFNKLDRVVPVKKAISNKNGKATLYHSGNTTMHSLSEFVTRIIGSDDTSEEVETITLDKFFEDEKIDNVDFLKIDVEGEEGKILSSSGFGTIASKIKSLMVEYHVWAGTNENLLRASLTDRGFKIEKVSTDASLILATR